MISFQETPGNTWCSVWRQAFLFFEAGDAKHLGDGQEHERRVQTVQSQHKAPNCLGLGKHTVRCI